MAVMYIMEFDGVGQAQYDGIMRDLALGGKTAPGGLFHAAGPVEGGWRVVDVWESADAMDAFFGAQLGAAMERNGVPAPRLTVVPVYGTLTPPHVAS